MQQIAILGSTGSIGHTSLRVITEHSDKFNVFALIAGGNDKVMFEQAIRYRPKFIVMANIEARDSLAKQLNNYFQMHGSQKFECELLFGEQSMCDVVAHPDIDQVIAAIVGGAGLVPTLAAVKAGKRILLANKESLVMCGKLFMQAVKEHNATLLPIDSEHNAIFQSLPEALQSNLGQVSLADNGIKSIILTGSGGPFLNTPLSDFKLITVQQAITHPKWNMGAKISVDSATMMNKGLEFIEARWLFNASLEEMEVILHPQSIIHSMVRYNDGSVIAQMGNADMAIPINHALTYPMREHSPAQQLDFFNLEPLVFKEPTKDRFPCLFLAKQASQAGQVATTILNAANEVIVAAFLDKRIQFSDIFRLNDMMLSQYVYSEPESVAEVLEIDKEVRVKTNELIAKRV
ncbi:1-deoxy-D-xylulose-5-phosphate reductoisomerase [Thorsellia anophelis]|uniref:1-deoxy-D-xylulose 5-phosphate reductoisomerase n=1 Tax=Thorsellia anophelis DSM 18579 TaxID=1123402 RepID=A0A1H9YQT3_9GAMM|nr:1-deoxy-D-xylulose-5-phosphate reductoisomerase [Thorsellia anophelis]SES71422.1 1-deoxy-D-xylulose 5-phosphate reductoisomerase [Thorsellia anophelis DSM 18579]